MQVKLSIIILSLLLFTGCAIKEKYKTVNSPLEASHVASYELSSVTREYKQYLGERISEEFLDIFLPKARKTLNKKIIAVTSIVNVNDFSKTSNFGRVFTDSMITDLERVGWSIIDIRGKTYNVKHKDGEFYLSRKELKKLPTNALILVGTYSNYKKGLILNLRLLDPKNNKVIVSSNLLLEDEESYKMANKSKTNDSTHIMIIEDDCSSANQCKE